MKKAVLILILFLSVIAGLNTASAGQTFYVYRSDKHINAFGTEEIDSIVYSRLDIDSVLCDSYVTQEIYTTDSVYRIPIEIIDSVGYITPKTVYRPGVRIIEGKLRENVIADDSLSVIYRAGTPPEMMPAKGDRIVALTNDEIIRQFFAGQVKEIKTEADGIHVICEEVYLADIFERFYGEVSSTEEIHASGDALRKPAPDLGDDTWSPGTLWVRSDMNPFGINYQPEESLVSIGGSVGWRMERSVTPEYKIHWYMLYDHDYGVDVRLTFYGDYLFEEESEFSGSVSLGRDNEKKKKDSKIFEGDVPLPYKCNLFIEVGTFLQANATILAKHKWTCKWRHFFNWEWSSVGKEGTKNNHRFFLVNSEHDGLTCIEGSIAGGVYGKLGIKFAKLGDFDIANIHLRLDGGVELVGSMVPRWGDIESADKETTFYNRIKNQYVEAFGFLGFSGNIEFCKVWSVSTPPEIGGLELGRKARILKSSFVPSFSDVKLTYDKSNSVLLATSIVGEKRETIWPKVDLGYALFKGKDRGNGVYKYLSEDYDGVYAKFNGVFENINDGDESAYTVYPLVKAFGKNIICDPSATNKTVHVDFDIEYPNYENTWCHPNYKIKGVIIDRALHPKFEDEQFRNSIISMSGVLYVDGQEEKTDVRAYYYERGKFIRISKFCATEDLDIDEDNYVATPKRKNWEVSLKFDVLNEFGDTIEVYSDVRKNIVMQYDTPPTLILYSYKAIGEIHEKCFSSNYLKAGGRIISPRGAFWLRYPEHGPLDISGVRYLPNYPNDYDLAANEDDESLNQVPAGVGVYAVDTKGRIIKSNIIPITNVETRQVPIRWSSETVYEYETVINFYGEIGPDYPDKYSVMFPSLLDSSKSAQMAMPLQIEEEIHPDR